MITSLAKVKRFLQITSKDYDVLITSLISQVEADYEKIRGRDFDVDSNDIIDYPDGSDFISAQMIGYLIQTGSLENYGNKKSESIGGYSYSKFDKADMLYGYPRSIVSRIERFVGLK